MRLKNVLGTWTGKLKGKDRVSTVENLSIVFIVFGALLLSVGMGMTALNPKGISAILAMLGGLIAFLSTLVLVFTWLIRELKGE